MPDSRDQSPTGFVQQSPGETTDTEDVVNARTDDVAEGDVTLAAHDFTRRLKTLGGITPYEYIFTVWTSEPDRFIMPHINQMPGLNTQVSALGFSSQGLSHCSRLS
jgi:hypothetical protein